MFALSGGGNLSPCKMKLKDANIPAAIYNDSWYGPSFGRGHDMLVHGSSVAFGPASTFHPWPLPLGSYNIKEMEVIQVTGSASPAKNTRSKRKQSMHTIQVDKQVTRFSNDINEALNANQECLIQAESEMLQLEESFKDEQAFIDKFATGDAKDVIVLNVSGAIMVTTRSTLQTAEDSVLAQQFDDSKWTEQGCDTPRVKEWTPDQVATWARDIDGLRENIAGIFYENEISGRELLAVGRDELKMMGIKRAGTLGLLLKEIEKLEKSSRDFVTLIEHSPYCFGKILNYLRVKKLRSQGLIAAEPDMPKVSDSQKDRFEKVAKYYFPGNSAKFILG
jgi:hypothetical protein